MHASETEYIGKLVRVVHHGGGAVCHHQPDKRAQREFTALIMDVWLYETRGNELARQIQRAGALQPIR